MEVCGADVTPNSKCQARRKLSTEIPAENGQKSKSEGAWPNSKDPKGNSEPGFTSRQDGTKILGARWGPPTLSSLKPKERGQENSRRAGVTSAAAPQVHGGEQHLLFRFWKPHRVESPRSQGHPVSQLWGGEGGVTWERGKGPRDRFGEGGMCYCEEGICLPRRKEEGNAGPAPGGRCMAEFIGGRKQGRKRARSTGRLHWSSRAATGRGPGQ